MKVLVSVASRHGSTAEIATALAASMRHRGAQVDVNAPEHVDDLGAYDVVVLGSAVYRGRWLRSAREFAERYASELRERDVYLFSSGPVASGGRRVDTSYDACAVAERVAACEHRTFPGKLDPAVLGTGERMVVRMFGAPSGDFRDWDAIGAWGARIVARTAGREHDLDRVGSAPAQRGARR
ncbi:flavodoxin domain-containing protein [Rhodococcus sp. R1101]|uniref:flavodoxin domain-containing protein n=1 Tax=Rhodococcus sp. R1101 TaxID=1170698 RepID=UPI0002DE14AE|nr:flavodoxin domain-containing protein [Rhodococcus sp. R1101]